MDAFDRMVRIHSVLVSSMFEKGDGRLPTLEMNGFLLLSDVEGARRSGIGGYVPKKRWVARWAGLVGEGDQPDDAALALEGQVFDMILSSIDQRKKTFQDQADALTATKDSVLKAITPTPPVPK